MSKSLIPIAAKEINGGHCKTVNARDLHRFLKSKQEFSTWIRCRIGQYDFKQDQDFIIFDKIVKNTGRGRPAIEYHITLDMAKELSMVERNERGQQARRYFIECERKLKEGPAESGHINNAQAAEIKQIIRKRAGELTSGPAPCPKPGPPIFKALYQRLNNHFGVSTYRMIPVKRFDEAVAFAAGNIIPPEIVYSNYKQRRSFDRYLLKYAALFADPLHAPWLAQARRKWGKMKKYREQPFPLDRPALPNFKKKARAAKPKGPKVGERIIDAIDEIDMWVISPVCTALEAISADHMLPDSRSYERAIETIFLATDQFEMISKKYSAVGK